MPFRTICVTSLWSQEGLTLTSQICGKYTVLQTDRWPILWIVDLLYRARKHRLITFTLTTIGAQG
jgi:hypothetical protein